MDPAVCSWRRAEQEAAAKRVQSLFSSPRAQPTRRARSFPSRRRLCGGQMRIDPSLDVVHDLFLADIVEEVVEVSLIEVELLVLRSDRVVEELASRRYRRLVGGAVHDQDRQ